MSIQGAELHERFAYEFLQDLSATAAYLRIRPDAKPAAAATMGWRLLRNVEVQAHLQRLRAKVLGRLEVTAERVLRELAVVAFSDVLNDYEVDEMGHLRLRDGADPSASRALASVKRRVTTVGRGEDVRTTIETEFKLWPKVEALKVLAQHLGLLKDPEASAGGCEIVLGPDESVRLIVRAKR